MQRKFLLKSLTVVLVFIFVGYVWAGEADQTHKAKTVSSKPTSSVCAKGFGHSNPADFYCLELGYKLELVVDKDGGQHTNCIFPDGSSCDTWRFLEGKCGASYSYCAKQGYGVITKTDGKNPFSRHYAVCVDDGVEVGSVTDLMGMDKKYQRSIFPGEEPPAVKPAPAEPEARLLLLAEQPPPASFSWRNHNGQDWMTAVKIQHACGSCWAFSAVATVEAVYNIHTNNPQLDLNLSEEYLNSDCPTTDDPGSCCGGHHDKALGVIKNEGIPDEECLGYDEGYYYTGDCRCFPDPDCNENCSGLPTNCSHLLCIDACDDIAERKVDIDDFFSVPNDQQEIKKALIEKGPLSVSLVQRGDWNAQGVYVCTDCWDLNDNDTCDKTAGKCENEECTSGGLGEGWPCENDADCDEDKNNDGNCDQDDCDTNHCVNIVGYDDAAGGHWIVKNNYGNSWNGDGYYNVGYGECHIEDHVYYAVANEDIVIADANGPYSVQCQGSTTGTTDVLLDGSGSFSGDGVLTYKWTPSCPDGVFDDATIANPTLTVDTSEGCSWACDVTLVVENGNGDSHKAVASVTVSDATPPGMLWAGLQEPIECDEGISPDVAGSPAVYDECDPNPIIGYEDATPIPGFCPQEYSFVRTWTATDRCGNVSELEQDIEVQDTTPPELTCPANVTVECDGLTDPSNTGQATATDNCDSAPVVSSSDSVTPGACPQEKTITRTWTATDKCGNASSCVQTIEVVDTTAPVIECNAPSTIIPPDAPISFMATATDNCDDALSVEVTEFDCYKYTKKGKRVDKTESCVVSVAGDTLTIHDSGGVNDHITWTAAATDACGNTSTKECEVVVVNPGKGKKKGKRK